MLDEIFSEMDIIIKQFLTYTHEERILLYQNEECECLLPKGRLTKMTGAMLDESRRSHVFCEFVNAQEIECFLKCFRSRCVVSGLDRGNFKMSIDRKIDLSGRYSWSDAIPMLASINFATLSFTILLCLLQLQIVLIEILKKLEALWRKYHSRGNLSFYSDFIQADFDYSHEVIVILR
jgi:hypothetical protein